MKAWLKAFRYEGRHRGKYKFHNGGVIVGPVRTWTLPEIEALRGGFSQNAARTVRVWNDGFLADDEALDLTYNRWMPGDPSAQG